MASRSNYVKGWKRDRATFNKSFVKKRRSKDSNFKVTEVLF